MEGLFETLPQSPRVSATGQPGKHAKAGQVCFGTIVVQ